MIIVFVPREQFKKKKRGKNPDQVKCLSTSAATLVSHCAFWFNSAGEKILFNLNIHIPTTLIAIKFVNAKSSKFPPYVLSELTINRRAILVWLALHGAGEDFGILYKLMTERRMLQGREKRGERKEGAKGVGGYTRPRKRADCQAGCVLHSVTHTRSVRRKLITAFLPPWSERWLIQRAVCC